MRAWTSYADAGSLKIEPDIQQNLADSLLNTTGILYLAEALDFQEKTDARKQAAGIELTGAILFQGIGESLDFETFEQALESFLIKQPTANREFYLGLEDTLKQKYFNIARIEEERAIEWIGAEVERALVDGVLLDEFKDNIDDILGNLGITPLKPWHSDLVYNQNLSNAYSAGRYEQWNIPENKEFYPYWQYVATLVNTRESHEALHLTIFRFGDAGGDAYLPPNGFNCRCQAVPVDVITAEEEGILPNPELPVYEDKEGNLVTAVPDEGFNANPSDSFRAIPEV